MDRVSTAGVLKRNGRFFLALRKPGTSIGESWEFPGGKKRDHESPREALKREWAEELGVSVVIGDLICEGKFKNREKGYHLQAYEVTAECSDDLLAGPFAEHERGGWFSPDELESLPMAYSDRLIVSSLIKSRKGE